MTEKLKKPLGILLRVVCFLLATVLLLLAGSYLLAPKNNTADSGILNPNARGFYSEPKGSIDIAVIGNSDAYSGFSPMELWNAEGITSYVSGEGKQRMVSSLRVLKEVLACQTPKVVILETDGIFTDGKLTDCIAETALSATTNVFSVFQYHDRWKRTTFRELWQKPDYTAHCVSKGQFLSDDTAPYVGGDYMKETRKRVSIPVSVRPYLEAFVRLCAEKNIPLLLVEMPSASSWNAAKHKAVQAFADEHGLTFLDLNQTGAEFGFDWMTDTRDRGNHLNCRGARKATLYLAEYLKNTYPLEDHRQDPDYAVWDQDYQTYRASVHI